MLLILDTSILVSVLLSDGNSYARDIINLAYTKKLHLIASSETFQEIRNTIKSEKIKKLQKYKPAKVGSFIAWYKYNAQFVSIDSVLAASVSSRDRNDNMYLVLAEKAKADFLITLDNDLLILRRIKKTKIITPEEFMKKNYRYY